MLRTAIFFILDLLNFLMYDIIGDVHGQASKLKKLLLKMGYTKTNGAYSHPTRKAVFVGDFINRGSEIKKTIRIVRNMVEGGHALAILGNHEINAIIYYLDKNGGLRKNRQDKYFLSLFKTIKEYELNPAELKEVLDWMRTLPLFLDLGDIRIVHACWSDEAIEVAKRMYSEGRIKRKIFKTIQKKQEAEETVSTWLLTKGVYLRFPSDLRVRNNKGIMPRMIRMKWWDEPANKTFGELSFESKFTMPKYTVPHEILPDIQPYPEDAPPVFFGHYCRGEGPFLIKHNICCVDSCVVGSGVLTAYRWSGERELTPENLLQV